MTYLSLFSGIGGMDLGLDRAGMTCIGQVEIDDYCRKVLAKHWPNVPKWADIRDFHGGMLSEKPDLICGGFPCQDISNAGKRAGIEGEQSGLWSEFARIIRELRPSYVLVENVAALLTRGIGRVLGDLAECGMDAEWSVVPACALGAPHTRERVFIVSYAKEGDDSNVSRFGQSLRKGSRGTGLGRISWWSSEPDICRVANGIPNRLHRNGALGNAVVPQVAEYIGRLILSSIGECE